MLEEYETLGLLDYIKREVNCSYISDLCQPGYLPAIKEAVRRIAPEAYDMGQWSDAVAYITKKKVQCDAVKDYMDYLLHL